jgi:hypothetical protein
MGLDQILLLPGVGKSAAGPVQFVIWETDQVVWEAAEVFWGTPPPIVFWEDDRVQWESADIYWTLQSLLPP